MSDFTATGSRKISHVITRHSCRRNQTAPKDTLWTTQNAASIVLFLLLLFRLVELLLNSGLFIVCFFQETNTYVSFQFIGCHMSTWCLRTHHRSQWSRYLWIWTSITRNVSIRQQSQCNHSNMSTCRTYQRQSTSWLSCQWKLFQ